MFVFIELLMPNLIWNLDPNHVCLPWSPGLADMR